MFFFFESIIGIEKAGRFKPACICWRVARLTGLSLQALGLKWKNGGVGLGLRRGLALGEAALGLGAMWA